MGFVLKRNSEIKQLSTGGSIIGVSDKPFKEESIKLKNGDKIILYTDGITEHQHNDGEMYSEQRLKNKLKELASDSCETIFNKIYKNVIEFGEDAVQTDDMSMLGIEYLK